MLPGFTGHLLSSAFIERQLAAAVDAREAERVRRELMSWRRNCAALGPASTPRTLLQSAAAPFFAALGFDPPSAVQPTDAGLAATLASADGAVALLVTPWGEPLDPLWRLAVTEAGRRLAPWCLVVDGLRLRIVDATRLYSRRYLEFDLDLVFDDPPAFAALCQIARAAALTAPPPDARSLHALVAASDRHAAGVCQSLRDGVLAASGEVLRALLARERAIRARRSAVNVDHAFEQALTIV
jgi:hypothetical protein